MLPIKYIVGSRKVSKYADVALMSLTVEDSNMVIKDLKIIRDNNWKKATKSVKPDSRKRVTLPEQLNSDVDSYDVFTNNLGQIILDPQVRVPASEAWIIENPDILSRLDKAMFESLHGEVVDRGSYAKYVEDAT